MGRPVCIGITGGIGSGKSTVCKMFTVLGVPAFEADKVGKQLLETNASVKSKIIRLFGDEIYRPDGAVNRKELADIVFNDDLELQKINQVIHPAVRKEFENWREKQNAPYLIHEAAILFESGFYKMMDYTILVTAPEEQRVDRVVKRDGVTVKQVRERMARQWPDEEKQKLASVVLQNDNESLIIPEIIKIDKSLKAYGKIW